MKVSFLRKDYYQHLINVDSNVSHNRMGVTYIHDDGNMYFFPISRKIIKTKKHHDDCFHIITHKNRDKGTIKINDFIIIDASLIEPPQDKNNFVQDCTIFLRKNKKDISYKARRTLRRSKKRMDKFKDIYIKFQYQARSKTRVKAEKYMRRAVESMSVLENIPNRQELTNYLFDGSKLINHPDKIDMLTAHNLKIAWEEMIYKLDHPLTLELIIDTNKNIARDQALRVGEMRDSEYISVSGITGSYSIKRPKAYEVENEIKNVNESILSRKFEYNILNFFIYLILNQLFYDGNKRTAFVVANKLLISNGIGIILFEESNHEHFHILLDKCFASNTKTNRNILLSFLQDECIHRFE